LEKFLKKHSNKILGVLSGFDRMIFRGCLKNLMYESGRSMYLYSRGILLKEFKNYATYYSGELKAKTQEYAQAQQRPFIYLQGNSGSKEKLARDIMVRDKIKKGLVCIMSTLEPCYSYKVVGNRATEKLEIKSYYTKCLHLYHYWNDPMFGLVHGRVQTWYPYNLQFYVNGREFLKNQMDSKNISYSKSDNCFTWVSDLSKANDLAKKQINFDWGKTMNQWTLKMNPLVNEVFPMGANYYWTLAQSEWASDILFKDTDSLDKIYSDLIHHSMVTFKSPDVMKFLGRRLTRENKIYGSFKGEVMSNLKERPEGVRVKHSVNANSIKIYDKADSVLRIETTINKPNEFKSYRPKLSTGELEWQPMRKSIEDLPRRAEISQKVIDSHLKALTSANTGDKFNQIISKICSPTTQGKLRLRGLDPFGKDKELLDVIIEGKFHINGFRNRDIRKNLFDSNDPLQNKRDSGKVSRRLRMLRAHGIIKKVPRTHRYLLTQKGIELISAVKTINNAKVSDLIKLAA
jgi:hypothetical protein